ncbi:MAG: tetraacyldisaccharide 4'-kinase [Asticcacaulis sp.]
MSLKTPQWWYRPDAKGAPWWRFLLWPLSLLWRLVNALKALNANPYRSDVYVISVGNVTLGGSGKTPVAAEILRLLSREGIKTAGLSRGYGGSMPGPLKVDPERNAAAEVGDEPLMLAKDAPFWVARDRAAGLRAIEAAGMRAVVVDDAHQNLSIVKDLHILVVDGDTSNEAWPFGDGGVCPYGPLREPLDQGLARADICVVWMPDGESQPDPQLLALLRPRPVFVARLVAEAPDTPGRVIGFAGIAKPWKFEATLRAQGFELIDFVPFPDHVSPSEAELEGLAARADHATAWLMTTKKDWVRLPPAWRQRVRCLPIRAQFDDEAGFVHALTEGIA